MCVYGEGGECSSETRETHSLSLVGRGFFSFVSVFFSFVLSKRAISVMSGLSDILAVKDGEKTAEHTDLTFSVALIIRHIDGKL